MAGCGPNWWIKTGRCEDNQSGATDERKSKTMTTSAMSVALQHLLADPGPGGDGRTDGELLARFVRDRDGDAVAALVRRHAPMVWGVCRRLLRNSHDAEDAFQATFLVLVRKAAGVPRGAVANWLYGVARQTAVRVRATAAKRGLREAQVVDVPEPTVPEVPDDEWQGVVDEELSRLPDHYRGVVVLCDLEGMTRKEAARQLGIPEGSVASRLARARALLAKRLTRRGVPFSGSVAVVSVASVPPALLASTIRAARLLAAGRAAGVSVTVAAHTEGVVKAMFVSKLKSVLSAALVVGLALGGIGAGVGLLPTLGAEAQDKTPRRAEDKTPDGKEKSVTKEEQLRRLIDKVLAAHGGEDKLKKLRFTMTVKTEDGTVNHYSVQPPKNFRWEEEGPKGGKLIVLLFPDGRRFWTKQPGKEAEPFVPFGLELPLEFWLDYVKFFGPRQVLRLTDADHKVVLLDGEARIGDRPAVGDQAPALEGRLLPVVPVPGVRTLPHRLQHRVDSPGRRTGGRVDHRHVTDRRARPIGGGACRERGPVRAAW